MTETPGSAGDAGFDGVWGWTRSSSRGDGGAPRGNATRDGAIAAFWDWWAAEGADRLDGAFTGGADFGGGGFGDAEPMDIQAEVGPRISAIDERLVWGFGPGEPFSRHLLTVTAAGDPEVRHIARRWLNAAPDDGPVWSFTDLRTAEPVSTVTWAGHEIDPAEARVAVAAGQGVADVRLYHPVFKSLAAAGEEGERDVAHVGFMLLQLALGEEDFGLWLRSFAFAAEEPEGAMALSDLPAFIDHLAGACPRWLTLQGQADDKPVMVGTRAPLSPLIGPLYTRHVVVQLLFADVLDDGQAAESSAKALADFGEDAMATLADDGMVVAAETADGVRLLHFYVDPETDATERLANLVDTWTEGDHEIVAAEDPAWERVGHLRA
ncbi:DUF695 domain-containing protein [Corynebacterium hansenii]|uniref:DUF695 domain-containing protein n=1 Tax=Corynebacterium hansenii TaxID=394964 RepID=A0ABV7ZP57_9CORY|nr:DUF695 domain-containing protein [Corynebacterium hansenii]WJZ01300.1 hypothetical protein CHAN_13605 [Corynebacterium hansenii]